MWASRLRASRWTLAASTSDWSRPTSSSSIGSGGGSGTNSQTAERAWRPAPSSTRTGPRNGSFELTLQFYQCRRPVLGRLVRAERFREQSVESGALWSARIRPRAGRPAIYPATNGRRCSEHHLPRHAKSQDSARRVGRDWAEIDEEPVERNGGLVILWQHAQLNACDAVRKQGALVDIVTRRLASGETPAPCRFGSDPSNRSPCHLSTASETNRHTLQAGQGLSERPMGQPVGPPVAARVETPQSHSQLRGLRKEQANGVP